MQFDIVWEDKAANHRLVEGMLDDAGVAAGSFVLLPELGDTGFSFDLDRIVDDRSLAWAAGLTQRRGIWLQIGHARRGPDGRGRNCAVIVAPTGRAQGTYEKIHPFSFGQESAHYSGGEHLLLARCDDVVFCPLICYDLRFPELWRLGAVEGAEIFTIGASWPSTRQSHWRQLLIARAIESQAFVLAANRVGNDPNLHYAGGSMIVSPHGEVLAEAGEEPCVLQADLDPAECRSWREQFPCLRDVRRSLLGSIDLHAPDPGDT